MRTDAQGTGRVGRRGWPSSPTWPRVQRVLSCLASSQTPRPSLEDSTSEAAASRVATVRPWRTRYTSESVPTRDHHRVLAHRLHMDRAVIAGRQAGDRLNDSAVHIKDERLRVVGHQQSQTSGTPERNPRQRLAANLAVLA